MNSKQREIKAIQSAIFFLEEILEDTICNLDNINAIQSAIDLLEDKKNEIKGEE